MQVGVEVEGLGAVMKAFRRAEVGITPRISSELRVIAHAVQAEAKRQAAQQGFTKPGFSGRGTGQLISKIKVSVKGPTAAIVESARSKQGYLYPAIYEYGKNAEGERGRRPFMEPAKKKMEPETIAAMEELIRKFQGEIFLP